MDQKRPKVGVGVLVKRGGQVLLGKRKNAHGEGSWCFPGGHLEFNESIEDCARREALEETGIQIKNLQLGPVTNDIFEKEGKHYVTLFVISDYDSGEVQTKEPDKSEGWDWFDWDQLPQPVFKSLENLLKSGFKPF